MNRPISLFQRSGAAAAAAASTTSTSNGQRPGLAVVVGCAQLSERTQLRAELNHLDRLGWRLHVFALANSATEPHAASTPSPTGSYATLVADEHALARRLISLDVPHVHAHGLGGPAPAAASAAQVAGITYSLSADNGEIDDNPSDHVRTLMSRAVFTLTFSGALAREAVGAAGSRLHVERVFLGVAQQSAAPMSLAELLSVCLRPLSGRSDTAVRHVF